MSVEIQARHNFKKWVPVWTSAVLAGLLAACGGGGDSTTAPTVLTGRYLDAAVAGLTYKTPTQEGITDASGSFKYLAGETIEFQLFGTKLSSSLAYSTLTPGDTGVEDTDLDQSVNQLRFLQTIDANNKPADGITLPTFNALFDINFKQRIEAFETDAKVLQFLTTFASGRPLVSVQKAVEHFNDTIQTVSSGTVLELAGKKATGVLINTACTNDVQTGLAYSFGAAESSASGSDGFDNSNGICTPSAPFTMTISNTGIPAGEFLHGMPSLTYKEVNHMVYRPADDDGRTTVEMSWHTPGTKTIRTIKRVLVDPKAPGNALALTTSKETVTIID